MKVSLLLIFLCSLTIISSAEAQLIKIGPKATLTSLSPGEYMSADGTTVVVEHSYLRFTKSVDLPLGEYTLPKSSDYSEASTWPLRYCSFRRKNLLASSGFVGLYTGHKAETIPSGVTLEIKSVVDVADDTHINLEPNPYQIYEVWCADHRGLNKLGFLNFLTGDSIEVFQLRHTKE